MRTQLNILISLCFIGVAGCPDDAPSGLAQIDATPSLPGLCGAGVEVCSDEGQVQCVAGGLRACLETSGCLHWGVVVACPPGAACEDVEGVAACVASCPDSACTVPEARRCVADQATSFQRCVDDGAGCLVWSEATACPEDQTCGQGGVCSGECANECSPGTERCEGNAVVTCGNHDDDACVEWGGALECEGGCALGRCVDTCQDECATLGLKRCDGNAVQVCVEGTLGCRAWAAAESCGPGTSCSLGQCAVECVDECAEGATVCDAGGVIVCTERDGDACRDRSLPAACADGEACSDGKCAPIGACSDECATLEDRRCDASGLFIEVCGQFDADACREWGRVEQCPNGDSCSLGRCVAGCEDECADGARRCRPGSATGVDVCRADGDVDACREWVAGEDCLASGQVCAQGACAASCADECQGDAKCDGNAVVPCGDFDADLCRDLGTPSACPPSEQCTGSSGMAACGPLPPPGGLLISEILYNSQGDDDDTFIEIAGTPFTPLAGFRLEAVNGDGGATYRSLSLVGSIPANGFFVIVHPQAEQSLLATADQKDAFADLQNGPDSLVLKWGDTVVDALGYGDFHAGDVFRGEGTAASNTSPGEALARLGSLQDTNDNQADFAVVPVPTPGEAFLSARRPSQFGDLVITEVMADPKAFSDALGEWFELANPHAGVTWSLGGCKIISESNESHTIQGTLLVPPNGRIALARSANPGFSPDYVYASISLNNDIDLIELRCDNVVIDDFVWIDTVPTGKSMSVDPFFEDAAINDDLEAWCPAPLDAAPNADAGTPGERNPPCPNQSGTYEGSALDSTWGACDDTPNWQAFVFESAPEPLDAATLSFEWWTVLCPLYAPDSEIWVEIEAGGSWVEVAHSKLTNGFDACTWLDATASVSKSVVQSARAVSGRVQGRFRIEGGCPSGVGCGLLGQVVPYNCARAMSLTYPY